MKNVAGLNYFARLAMNTTKGSTHFVLNFLLNKDLHQRKLIFLLPSIEIESTSLDVVIWLLVYVETEHSQTWPLSRFRPLFSNFCIRLDTIIGHSFSTKHGKYLEVKKFLFACQHSMISPFCIKLSRIVALRQLYVRLHRRFNPVVKLKAIILLKFYFL